MGLGRPVDLLTIPLSPGMSHPFTDMKPMSYVAKPVSIDGKNLTGGSGEPVCTLDGNHLTTFDNRTMRVTFDDVGPNYIFGYCQDIHYGDGYKRLHEYLHDSGKQHKMLQYAMYSLRT